MMERYSIERDLKVYHDGEGWCVGIRHDNDGMDLPQIYYREKDRPETTITMTWPCARLFARALSDFIAAQGTEAQRAETVEQGSVHDGPVGEADAPKDPSISSQGS